MYISELMPDFGIFIYESKYGSLILGLVISLFFLTVLINCFYMLYLSVVNKSAHEEFYSIVEDFYSFWKFLTGNSKSKISMDGNLGANHSELQGNFFMRITSFRGRIGREQFFYGLLFKFALMAILGFLVVKLAPEGGKNLEKVVILTMPLSLFVIWVNLSLQARRLHDMGKSGYLLLLYLVPALNLLFGLAIYIACLITEGEKRSNKYGDTLTRIF